MKLYKLAVFTLVFTLAICGSSFAEYVGIPQDEFSPHYRAQQGLMLCWAASAEMVLSYQGINLPQDAIVTKARGVPVNAPGGPWEMFRVTNGIFQTAQNNDVLVLGQFIPGPAPTAILFNQLKHKRPVILTYQQQGSWVGHAVVLIGMDVTIDKHNIGNEIIPTSFYVADPFSYRQKVNTFGQPIYQLGQPVFERDGSLAFRKYNWGNGMVLNPFPGTITGMIFMDASQL